jgi:hypothetical protein
MPGGKIRISIISSKMSHSAIAVLFVALHMGRKWHQADLARSLRIRPLSARSGCASERDQRSTAPAETTPLIAAQRKAADQKGGPCGGIEFIAVRAIAAEINLHC